MTSSAKNKKHWLLEAAFLIPVFLFCTIAGCSTTSSNVSDSQQEAIKCSRNWKALGYNFDPNSMTCSQMFERVSAIQRARYWIEKGYIFDPNSMTTDEMNRKVGDIDRARYWKEIGYEFDAYSMTAQEMDEKVKGLDEAKYWEKLGYYYDPNSQKVFLSKDKRTELGSLAGIDPGSTYAIPNFRTSGLFQVREAYNVMLETYYHQQMVNAGTDTYLREFAKAEYVVRKQKINNWFDIMTKKFEFVDQVDFLTDKQKDLIKAKIYENEEEPIQMPTIAALKPTEPTPQAKIQEKSTGYQAAQNLPRMRTKPASSGSFYPNTGSGHWVKRNIDSGRFIQLEDDSLWQVEPLDHTTSWLWLYLTDVSVTESQDVSYPFLLINTEDREVVKARLIVR